MSAVLATTWTVTHTLLFFPFLHQPMNFCHIYLLSFSVSIRSHHLQDFHTGPHCSPVIAPLHILNVSNTYNLEMYMLESLHLFAAVHILILEIIWDIRFWHLCLKLSDLSRICVKACSWLIPSMLIFVCILVGTVSILCSSFLARLCLDFLHQHWTFAV